MSLNEDRATQHYLTHGFRRVVVRHDEPNFVYPIHFHAYNLVFQILTGSMQVTANHRRTDLATGAHAHIPAGQLHTVLIGPHGCTYIHAEKEPDHPTDRA